MWLVISFYMWGICLNEGLIEWFVGLLDCSSIIDCCTIFLGDLLNSINSFHDSISILQVGFL